MQRKITGADSPEFVALHMDTMEKRAAKVLNCADKMTSACEKLRDTFSLLAPVFEGERLLALDGRSLEIAEEDIAEFEKAIMCQCNAIYQIISKPVPCAEIRSPETAQTEDFLRPGQGIFGIGAWVKNGKLYVKLPMLGRRISYLAPGCHGRPVAYDYSKIFAADVSKAVNVAIPELGETYRDFLPKTITFLFNYDPEESNIIDSDSHDTKAIIDAIAIHFPGGDTATLCDIVYSSDISTALPQGTYACISPGKGTPQTKNLITDFQQVLAEEASKKP